MSVRSLGAKAKAPARPLPQAPAVAGASRRQRNAVDLEDDIEIASAHPPKRRASKSSTDEAEGPDDVSAQTLQSKFDKIFDNKRGRSCSRTPTPEQRSGGRKEARASSRSGGGTRVRSG